MMKKGWVAAVAVAIVIFLGAISPFVWAADYDIVDINNPFLSKIPTAIPIFKAVTGSEMELELRQGAADMLSEMLAFTGYFEILNRRMFLADPRSPNIVGRDINFQNWSGIGAELLVTGGIEVQGELLVMDLRLFDTFKADLVVGKRYRGRLEDQRRMTRRFCSDVIYALTGSRGIFDSKIAFISTATGHKEVYVCDFDGEYPTQFTRNNSITLSPAWSHDGQWLAYTSYVKGRPDLYIRHVREKRGVVVSRNGVNIAPAWRPKDNVLAATLSFEGDPEIYLLTESGKITKRLTNSRNIDVSASWSPDGSQIAFVSKRAGTPQIYVMDISSGEARRVTFTGKNNTQPAWSPKGDQIAYTAMDNGHFDVMVIGTDGKGGRKLTGDAGDNESPSWAPDGSLIVFSSTREGTSKIYVMTAFGTDQRRLIDMPGSQSEPRWSLNFD